VPYAFIESINTNQGLEKNTREGMDKIILLILVVVRDDITLPIVGDCRYTFYPSTLIM
jgi:hypothetical protein